MTKDEIALKIFELAKPDIDRNSSDQTSANSEEYAQWYTNIYNKIYDSLKIDS